MTPSAAETVEMGNCLEPPAPQPCVYNPQVLYLHVQISGLVIQQVQAVYLRILLLTPLSVSAFGPKCPLITNTDIFENISMLSYLQM